MSLSTDLLISTDFRDGGLPVLVTPSQQSSNQDNKLPLWEHYKEQIKEVSDKLLPEFGGILFRGFQQTGTDESCKKFANLFNDQLLSYEFGSTPRTDLGEGVYTATEYPSHQIIPLHNEQAYTLQWPLKIWFHCVKASEVGGQTPIADSRRIYQKIPKDIRERFEQKKLMYVRNFGNGLDLPWSNVFNTESKEQVESYCLSQAIDFEWKEDGQLRTKQTCQATAQHLTTKEWVWFNQAHLFHVSNLEQATREVLLDIVEMEDLPRNVYYGDGTEIEDSILDDVRGVLEQESVYFDWQEGDFLMLDNMLSAHGRSTFSGQRKIVVAMAEGHDSTKA